MGAYNPDPDWPLDTPTASPDAVSLAEAKVQASYENLLADWTKAVDERDAANAAHRETAATLRKTEHELAAERAQRERLTIEVNALHDRIASGIGGGVQRAWLLDELQKITADL